MIQDLGALPSQRPNTSDGDSDKIFRTMRKAAFVAWVGLLCAFLGCMSDPKLVRIVVGPDGKRWMLIECDEKKECWRESGRRCPEGYVTAKEGSDVSGSGSGAGGYSSSQIGTSTAMMIRCTKNATP